MYAVEVEGLSVSYFETTALEQLSARFTMGQLVGIIGPNGAGKSTFIKAIMGLIPAEATTITLLGLSTKEARTRVAYVPQRSAIDWDFPIRVLDAVLIGCYPKLGLFKRPRKQHRQLAMSCLERVGMQDYANRQIGELSGGQQQRVFLARALAQEAELLLLDEPFVGVDAGSERVIIDLLRTLRDEGKTIVVVHHDLSKAADYFDTLLLLNRRMIAVGSPTDVLQAKTIEGAYGNPLAFLQKVEVSS
ncbi:metal ABC transporter ATP-binding protein [Exiguobacterium antarcticum]|uniref:metal ABC transporter ATP-binding protein n=1 Tax=Exiguobacterium antarcticum TaxID=132920 RepID=UPI000285EC36|nr:metal ABC transporter ATP-binding protein [Exiguobacterium antarcticum]AFS71647.1 ABC transporter related protein [Exiguobacterium antarcticum B7]